MNLLPFAVTETLRLSVSIKRINKLLNSGDMDESPIKAVKCDDKEEAECCENVVEVRSLLGSLAKMILLTFVLTFHAALTR